MEALYNKKMKRRIRESPIVTKDLYKEVFPPVRDAILLCLKNNKDISDDQLIISLLSSLASYISVLINSGNKSQGYRAAINAASSVPSAVNIANKLHSNIHDPQKKLKKTFQTASSLISQAATTPLTEFPPEKRLAVGRDIIGITHTYTTTPLTNKNKNTSKHIVGSGSKMFGGTEINKLNTEWLEPTNLSGGAWYNPFSWFSGDYPEPEFTSRPPPPPPTGIIPVEGTYQNLDDPTAQARFKKYATFFNNPANRRIEEVNDVADRFEDAPPVFGPYSSTTPVAQPGGWWNKLSNIGSNPAVQMMIMGVLPTVAKGLGKFGIMLGDRILSNVGSFANSYIQQIPSEAKDDDKWYHSLGKWGARRLKNVADLTGTAYKGAKNFINDDRVQRELGKISKTIDYMAPAFAQDFVGYQQQMKAYNQMYNAAKSQHEYNQRREEAEVARENAMIKAQAQREHDEAEAYNQNVEDTYKAKQKHIDDLKAYDQKILQSQRDYDKSQLELEKIEKKLESNQLLTELDIKRSKQCANMITEGISGLAHGVKAGVATYGAYKSASLSSFIPSAAVNFGDARDQAGLANRYLDLAREATQNGDTNGALNYQKMAVAELKKGRQAYAQGLQETESHTSKLLNTAYNEAAAMGTSFHNAFDSYQDQKATKEQMKNEKLRQEAYDKYTQLDETKYVAAPREDAVKGLTKFVPAAITDDTDPRLKKFIRQDFIAPVAPQFMPTATMMTASQVIPAIWNAEEKKKKVEMPDIYEMPKSAKLKYVNPSSGSNSKLRTTVLQSGFKNPALLNTQPYSTKMYGPTYGLSTSSFSNPAAMAMDSGYAASSMYPPRTSPYGVSYGASPYNSYRSFGSHKSYAPYSKKARY